MTKRTDSLLLKNCFFSLSLIIIINLFNHSSIAQDNPVNMTISERLIRAVKRSRIDTVRFLIRSRMDLNDLEKFTITPLMWAARRGDIEMARLLIEEGNADVNLPNSENATALTYAVFSNDIDVVKYFVEEAGANLHYRRQTILIQLVVLRYGNRDIIEYFVSRLGDDVNAQDISGATALMHAALYGDMDMVRFLVEEAEANIYLQDVSGASAVIYAVDGGHTNIADYLIDVGTEGFLRFICKTTSYYLCNQQMWFYQ